MHVLLTDQVFPDIDVETALLGDAGHTFEIARTAEEAIARLPHADAVLTTFFPLPREVIATMSRARIIARYGIGVDNVDIAAAREAGIVVTNVPDYCVEEVAAHSVAMALSLLRGLPRADAATRDGRWGVAPVRPLHRISTLRVGLLGFGRIGRLVAASMATFGCTISVYDPYAQLPEDVQSLGLDELVESSDVLLLHAPLTDETRGIIDAARIASMPQGAILVNAARGPLVVLEDLVAALRSGHLGGAALDTFPIEPIDPRAIAGAPNLLVSPHTAYYSEEAIRESQMKATIQVLKVLSGTEPDYQVNR